jgi:hypothetical protein
MFGVYRVNPGKQVISPGGDQGTPVADDFLKRVLVR